MEEKDKEELDKCKENQYYFATKYMSVKDQLGNIVPFKTNLTETQFNEAIKGIEKSAKKPYILKWRGSL